MIRKYKISAVSYLNTLPFIDGIRKTNFINEIEISMDIPSLCADKLMNDEADIGLVPIAILPSLNFYEIITDYCLGSNGKVRTVVLLSNVPLNEIKTIHLDYQSRTSVMLIKVLAVFFWKMNFKWCNTTAGFEDNVIRENEAAVIIGDRVFDYENTYSYVYDLSEEWTKYTGLPFVFAAWVANKSIDFIFHKEFNSALRNGVQNISSLNVEADKIEYLTNNISYTFDVKKKEALALFLSYIEKINTTNA